MVSKPVVGFEEARKAGVKVYKRFKVRTATIEDGIVYESNKDSYVEIQGYEAASNVQAGLFGRFIQFLSKRGLFYVVPRSELKQNAPKVRIGRLADFDGVSVSSVNRPLSKLMLSPGIDRCFVERWVNPMAIITDGFRSINTFLYNMPIVRLDNERRHMWVKSRLPIKAADKVIHELFGIPAVTVFVDKDSADTDALLAEITGVPVSLAGDGFVVSDAFTQSILVETDTALVKLPETFKMQGVARSKGIVIAKMKRRVEIEVDGHRLPVDVIANTQGKRRNKAAVLTLSGLRLMKYLGKEVPVLDTRNKALLESVRDSMPFVTGALLVDGRYVGDVVVGIGKYYIDLSHSMEPKIDSSRMFYIQTRTVLETCSWDLEPFERFTREDVIRRAECNISKLDDILNKIGKEVGINDQHL